MTISKLIEKRAQEIIGNINHTRIHDWPRKSLFDRKVYEKLCELTGQRVRHRTDTGSESGSNPDMVTNWDTVGYGKATAKHKREAEKHYYQGIRMVGKPDISGFATHKRYNRHSSL